MTASSETVPSRSVVLDLFAGPGGWSEGLRMLGLSDIGIEWDEAACATRAAAGHLTIRADVSQYTTGPFLGKVWGLIASPPCQDFSVAGKMAGRTGEKGQLIDDVPRWVDHLRPEWIAFEQVPPALPVWEEFAFLFRRWGYAVWTGILDAADYGVPQNRLRAFLLAHRGIVRPPVPTHAEHPAPALFGPDLEPWVSLEDALGIGPVEMAYKRGAGLTERHGERPNRPGSRPSFTLTGSALGGGGGPKMVLRTGANTMKHGRTAEHIVRYERATDRPAPTVDSKVLKAWKIDERPLTIVEALTLQSFRPDYPIQGGKGKQGEQIGNAVPPLLAAHVVGALTGRTLREEVAA